MSYRVVEVAFAGVLSFTREYMMMEIQRESASKLNLGSDFYAGEYGWHKHACENTIATCESTGKPHLLTCV